MSRFGGGPAGLQGEPLALSSKTKTLWREMSHGQLTQDLHLMLI